MNQFKGIISKINSSVGLSIIYLDCQGISLKSITINEGDGDSSFTIGQEIQFMFKETEVFIGKGWSHQISLQNQLKGVITRINSGQLIAELTIETPIGMVSSIITNDAIKNLHFKEGDKVTAMIKTNEILLSH